MKLLKDAKDCINLGQNHNADELLSFESQIYHLQGHVMYCLLKSAFCWPFFKRLYLSERMYLHLQRTHPGCVLFVLNRRKTNCFLLMQSEASSCGGPFGDGSLLDDLWPLLRPLDSPCWPLGGLQLLSALLCCRDTELKPQTIASCLDPLLFYTHTCRQTDRYILSPK